MTSLESPVYSDGSRPSQNCVARSPSCRSFAVTPSPSEPVPSDPVSSEPVSSDASIEAAWSTTCCSASDVLELAFGLPDSASRAVGIIAPFPRRCFIRRRL
jgi:hypothetical protein